MGRGLRPGPTIPMRTACTPSPPSPDPLVPRSAPWRDQRVDQFGDVGGFHFQKESSKLSEH